MIIKILGLLDLFIAISFWLFATFNIISSSFIILLGIFLLVKGIVFATNLNIASIFDILSALIIISTSSIEFPILVTSLVSIFLLQKGIFSLLN